MSRLSAEQQPLCFLLNLISDLMKSWWPLATDLVGLEVGLQLFSVRLGPSPREVCFRKCVYAFMSCLEMQIVLFLRGDRLLDVSVTLFLHQPSTVVVQTHYCVMSSVRSLWRAAEIMVSV